MSSDPRVNTMMIIGMTALFATWVIEFFIGRIPPESEAGDLALACSLGIGVTVALFTKPWRRPPDGQEKGEKTNG
jgi:hypothetical protein